MAVEWMDNFQNYGTGSTGLDNLLDGMWAEENFNSLADPITADPDGVSSGNVIKWDTTVSNGDVFRRVLPSGTQTTVGTAWRWWLDELPAVALRGPAMQFRDSSNGVQITVSVNTTGTISVYLGTVTGTLLETTDTPVITAAAWNHIEAKVLFDNASSGTVEVRVNGLEVISLTGQDTQATAVAGCAQIAFLSVGQSGAFGVNQTTYLKDVICWNGTGAYNNDFVGDVQVVTLIPNADVSFNWDASTGTTGFDLIDESVPNDADYISADATPPAASVFGLSDLDPEVVTVKALMPVSRMLKTDGGTANVQMSLRSNGSDDSGTDRPITVAATYWFDISEEDPDTSTAWSPPAVDAAQLVINRTA